MSGSCLWTSGLHRTTLFISHAIRPSRTPFVSYSNHASSADTGPLALAPAAEPAATAEVQQAAAAAAAAIELKPTSVSTSSPPSQPSEGGPSIAAASEAGPSAIVAAPLPEAPELPPQPLPAATVGVAAPPAPPSPPPEKRKKAKKSMRFHPKTKRGDGPRRNHVPGGGRHTRAPKHISLEVTGTTHRAYSNASNAVRYRKKPQGPPVRKEKFNHDRWLQEQMRLSAEMNSMYSPPKPKKEEAKPGEYVPKARKTQRAPRKTQQERRQLKARPLAPEPKTLKGFGFAHGFAEG